jgi:hypothetical protein
MPPVPQAVRDADAAKQRDLWHLVADKLREHATLATPFADGTLMLVTPLEMLVFGLPNDSPGELREALATFVTTMAGTLKWRHLKDDSLCAGHAICCPEVYKGLEHPQAIALRGIFGAVKESVYSDAYPADLVRHMALSTLRDFHHLEGSDGKFYYPETGCSNTCVISLVKIELFPFDHWVHAELATSYNFLAELFSRKGDAWNVASIHQKDEAKVWYIVYRASSCDSAEAALESFEELKKVPILPYAEDKKEEEGEERD